MAREEIQSEVTGTVWKIEMNVGDDIADGDIIMILESMKMEIPVEAPVSGALAELRVAEGEIVEEGAILAVIE